MATCTLPPLLPSFETHRLRDAPQDEVRDGFTTSQDEAGMILTIFAHEESFLLRRQRIHVFDGIDETSLNSSTFHFLNLDRPHPEERPLGRVSKDGCGAGTRRHPSRRA
jgi:hypothetical protein